MVYCYLLPGYRYPVRVAIPTRTFENLIKHPKLRILHTPGNPFQATAFTTGMRIVSAAASAPRL